MFALVQISQHEAVAAIRTSLLHAARLNPNSQQKLQDTALGDSSFPVANVMSLSLPADFGSSGPKLVIALIS